MICPKDNTNMIGIEYPYWHENHYDGVSEWKCLQCGLRIGRWSNKELEKGESEKLPVFYKI